MKTVAFHNLGCKVNSYEMDAMLQDLRKHGYTIVPFEEKADIYIVNTCTVTNMADRKSRQMLHKAKKTNPEGIVVAVGCYVQSDTEGVRADDAVDLMVGNNRKKDLVAILEQYMEGIDTESVIDINHTDEYEEMRLTGTEEHTRAYIKIQDGCNQFCSYCMIPYARGRVRSRRKEDILEEIRGLVQAGYQEFVLTGIHISSYGVDFQKEGVKQENLLTLSQEIDRIDGVKRLRLGSLEPRIITEEFAKGIGALEHICPHFHLSLQSGCEETLKRMNRHYTPEQFYAGVELLRRTFEHPAITTDVIVGFPGETEEEFERTRSFLEKVSFYEMHIFKYSKRKGTRAAVMENQVPEPVKTGRSNVLLEMEERDSAKFREYYLGRDVEVLFEEKKEIAGREYWIGHTREYVKVALADDGDYSNCLLQGKITDALDKEVLLMEKNALNFQTN
ncbi:MAG: tRNA (N(6)-L-threonylcarbamoyladenosine(37)-C(2))-methylthiotransferase MtaB [Lachnospiraceae bacterium]|nr:tRNA (N(6)-L-threonylcarbamoyladenosine(37)-C(2))-methylthiotransferase MtaB [Lachnospiraceae bacterium]